MRSFSRTSSSWLVYAAFSNLRPLGSLLTGWWQNLGELVDGLLRNLGFTIWLDQNGLALLLCSEAQWQNSAVLLTWLLRSYSPSQTLRRRFDDAKFVSETLKRRCWERLGEDIGELEASRNVANDESFESHTLSDIVIVNLKVLRSLVERRVSGEMHRWEIITIQVPE